MGHNLKKVGELVPVLCHLLLAFKPFIKPLLTLAPVLFTSELTVELLGLLRLAPPSGEFKLKLWQLNLGYTLPTIGHHSLWGFDRWQKGGKRW